MNCIHCNTLLDSAEIEVYKTSTAHSNTFLIDYMKKTLNCEVNRHSKYICKICCDIFDDLDLAQLTCTRLRNRIFERWIFIECKGVTQSICFDTNKEQINQIKEELLNDVSDLTDIIDSSYKSFTNNTRNKNSKPYECKVCKKKFISKKGMALHVQRKHGNKSVDDLSTKNVDNTVKYDSCIKSEDVDLLVPLLIDDTPNNSKIDSDKSKTEEDKPILKPSIYSDCLASLEVPLEPQLLVETSLNSCNSDRRKIKNKNPILKPTQYLDCLKSEAVEPLPQLNDESSSNSCSIECDDKAKTKKRNSFRPLKPLKYSCPQCSKMWRTLGELRTHVETHSAARPYICEICGQAYKHKSALEIHVGMHNGIHPFKCDFCNKTFTQKGALHRHMPIHTGEAPFQCDLCGKRFLHHTSFNMHTLAHTGEKSYKCTVCGLALLSGSHLKRHMRVHTGERRFACGHCGKRFAERYNLAAHQRLHEESASDLTKRLHRCQVCNATFDRRPKLEEHLASNHNKISETDPSRNWVGHFITNS